MEPQLSEQFGWWDPNPAPRLLGAAGPLYSVCFDSPFSVFPLLCCLLSGRRNCLSFLIKQEHLFFPALPHSAAELVCSTTHSMQCLPTSRGPTRLGDR